MNKKDKVAVENNSKDLEIENNKKLMKNKNKEEIGVIEDQDDVTKYGEFVSSYFAWITLEGQKKRAKDMQNMTDKSK